MKFVDQCHFQSRGTCKTQSFPRGDSHGVSASCEFTSTNTPSFLCVSSQTDIQGAS